MADLPVHALLTSEVLARLEGEASGLTSDDDLDRYAERGGGCRDIHGPAASKHSHGTDSFAERVAVSFVLDATQPFRALHSRSKPRAVARPLLVRETMMFDPQTPVASIVLDHSECAAVFARHHIDYCCKGQRALAKVCEDQGLPLPSILEELDLAVQRRSPTTVEPKDVSTRELITSVIARHHRYLHRALPFVQELADKVARVHGSREPSLAEVARLVTEIAVTFQAHLKVEEEVLFPALLTNQLTHVAEQLAAMRREHDEVGRLLEEVRRAAADFAPPEWACNSYRTLMRELAELEADTLRHVHIENHVLLPRFVA